MERGGNEREGGTVERGGRRVGQRVEREREGGEGGERGKRGGGGKGVGFP